MQCVCGGGLLIGCPVDCNTMFEWSLLARDALTNRDGDGQYERCAVLDFHNVALEYTATPFSSCDIFFIGHRGNEKLDLRRSCKFGETCLRGYHL